jgi:hypothetical protein
MNQLVSIFAQHNATEPTMDVAIAAVVQAIRQPSAKVAGLVAAIRAETDKERRRALKAQLPAVCFGARLKTRKSGVAAAEKILAESGVVCLDFDGVEDPEAAKAKLSRSHHVLAAFVSPSGSGVKALVPILGPFQAHWRALAHWAWSEHGLTADEARKDVCGLCYASHDPAIWVAPDPAAVVPFAGIMEEPRPVRQAHDLPGRSPQDGEVLADFLDSRAAEAAIARLDPDMEYSEWIEVGQAIHCQFGGGGQGLALWDAWSVRGSKYAGTEDVAKHYQSFRSSGVTFRTVLKKALDAGYEMPKRTTSTARVTAPQQPADKPKSTLGEFIAREMDGSYHLTPWPWPVLTEMSRSLFPGAVTILCGAPGASKSWFGLACLNFWTTQGVNAHVLMLEEQKAWHLNRLLTMLEGNKDFLDPDKTKRCPLPKIKALEKHHEQVKAVEDRIWCQGNLTMAACAEWVEQRCDEGARVIWVDPITLADTGEKNSWDADKRFMARCQDAIGKSGASLVLVTHPRKSNGPQKGPASGQDMAGGAVYDRASSSILWLGPSEPYEEIEKGHDTVSARADRKIQILKSRNGVGTGKHIVYQFNDFTFEEIGVAETKERKPKDAKGTYQSEMHEMEKARRKSVSLRLADKPQSEEDLFA